MEAKLKYSIIVERRLRKSSHKQIYIYKDRCLWYVFFDMPVPHQFMQTAANASPTDTSAIPTQVPPLDDTFGALLIGTFMGLMCVYTYLPEARDTHLMRLMTFTSLLGINLYQALRYARAFPGDPLWIKTLVWGC